MFHDDKTLLVFCFLKEKKKIPISGNSSPIFESLLVPEKKKENIILQKGCMVISDHTVQTRLYGGAWPISWNVIG